MATLLHNTYGKADVGLLKVFRDGDRQTVRELMVSVRLLGRFEANYLEGDNASCVPTDTIKNTVYALAEDCFANGPIEFFARDLAEHYLASYAHVESVELSIREAPWQRMGDHDHSFQRSAGTPTTRIVASRDGHEWFGGVSDVTVLKSTGSGFVGFHTCGLTTLPESTDRILATTITAEWQLSAGADPAASRSAAVEQVLRMFSDEYSPSVQRTLFRMGEEVLAAAPDIEQIRLHLPNEHYFAYDLERFGRENGSVFYPSTKPYGDIEAVVGR